MFSSDNPLHALRIVENIEKLSRQDKRETVAFIIIDEPNHKSVDVLLAVCKKIGYDDFVMNFVKPDLHPNFRSVYLTNLSRIIS